VPKTVTDLTGQEIPEQYHTLLTVLVMGDRRLRNQQSPRVAFPGKKKDGVRRKLSKPHVCGGQSYPAPAIRARYGDRNSPPSNGCSASAERRSCVPRTLPLLFNLTPYPIPDLAALEPPRSADFEARNLARRSQLVGGLLIDFGKLSYCPKQMAISSVTLMLGR
jgi:hypothetical protein